MLFSGVLIDYVIVLPNERERERERERESWMLYSNCVIARMAVIDSSFFIAVHVQWVSLSVCDVDIAFVFVNHLC